MNTWENIKQEDSYNDDDSIDADCDDELNNDAEGVWSPDIEQSFQEALAIYPPCGRRKIILSEEGKMYGRNELIARYIKLRTGKTRTRKQVSSHIQVLAKRKTKDFCTKDPSNKTGQPQQHLTSAQIISPTILGNNKSFLNFANQNPIRQAPTSINTSSSSQNSHITQSTPTSQHQNQCNNLSYQNGILNNAPSNSTQIWSHPGLQADTTKVLVQAAAAAAAAAASSFYPQSGFTPEVIAALQTSSSSSTAAITGNPGCRLNTPNSTNSSPSQTPPPSSSNSSSHHNLTQSQLWHHLPKTIGSHKLHLMEFSGFLEQRRDDFYHRHLFVHLNPELQSNDNFECINIKEFADKFPDTDLLTDKRISYLVKFWVDLNYTIQEGASSLYAVTNIFESPDPLTISCSTKVCSFGNQVVEKIETEHSRFENGRYVYRIENSPMCEYMITFINKLKQLPEKYSKNSVLENFSVLQFIRNHDTQELLLSLAYLFEVSTSEHGAQHVIYRLTNK